MGAKGKSQLQLTPLELQIMNVLWDCGPSNVQSVQDKLTASPKLAYTTVQTMLDHVPDGLARCLSQCSSS